MYGVEGKWGIIDEVGQWVVNPTYDQAYGFSEDLSAVRKKEVYGYINTEREVIADGFENAYPFSEGVAGVKIGGKWGFINKEGKPCYWSGL